MEQEKKERVQKVISRSGYCSRRKAEELIEKGLVRVNGKPIKLGHCTTKKDKITIEGQKIAFGKKAYIMLNKPRGYECTLEKGRKNILSLVKLNERVYHVGRLDKSTKGMLILTNDGEFANKIMHPSRKIEKTYIARLDKKITQQEVSKLNKGIRLRDGKVFPKISILEKNKIIIKIQEGRKHLIKRMLFKKGYFVKELSRTAIGKLKLDVPEGKWRMLEKKDIEKIFS